MADAEPVRVRIPAQLVDVTSGERLLTAGPGPVRDVIAEIDERHPGFAERVLDVSGLRRGLAVYLDGVDLRMGDGLATMAAPASQLVILPVAGITPSA